LKEPTNRSHPICVVCRWCIRCLVESTLTCPSYFLVRILCGLSVNLWWSLCLSACLSCVVCRWYIRCLVCRWRTGCLVLGCLVGSTFQERGHGSRVLSRHPLTDIESLFPCPQSTSLSAFLFASLSICCGLSACLLVGYLLCVDGTANPTWGDIFESSKLKARTSLLPCFSEKRRSSFEL